MVLYLLGIPRLCNPILDDLGNNIFGVLRSARMEHAKQMIVTNVLGLNWVVSQLKVKNVVFNDTEVNEVGTRENQCKRQSMDIKDMCLCSEKREVSSAESWIMKLFQHSCLINIFKKRNPSFRIPSWRWWHLFQMAYIGYTSICLSPYINTLLHKTPFKFNF